MLTLYNFILPLLLAGLRFLSLFNPKLKRGLEGRRTLLKDVQQHYKGQKITGPRIQIHVASYGELEQAKPVISEIRTRHPDAHIHLTFFSPSGYENTIGKYSDVNFISYLPIDRRKDVREFLGVVKPDIVLFARYDVWPNIALELSRRSVPTVLFAATASERSGRMMPFVKPLHARMYRGLTRILVISDEDRARFASMGIKHDRLVVVGDTRYDQVLARKMTTEAGNRKPLPDDLTKRIEHSGTLVFMLGSSWPEDEAIIERTLKESIERKDNILWVIVPHEPSEYHVERLLSTYRGNAIRLSAVDGDISEPIIVVDSIGKLFGLYRHANIAMIGGGFSHGLHNSLEAAVWGVPSIVGPNHRKSQEVREMIDDLAAFEVKSEREFDFVLWHMIQDVELRQSAGGRAECFVEARQGATGRIIAEIEPLL